MEKRILCVETFRPEDIASFLKEKCGVNCDTAVSADEAIQKISANKYDLLFLRKLDLNYKKKPEDYEPDTRFEEKFRHGMYVVNVARKKDLLTLVLLEHVGTPEAEEIERLGGVVIKLTWSPKDYISKIEEMLKE